MEYKVLILLTAVLFISCETHPSTDTEQIREEILGKGQNIIDALNTSDIQALSGDFWESDSTLFLIDGMKVEGYANIRNAMESIPQRRKKLELTVDNQDVYVLSENAAVHLVEFRQEETFMNDSVATDSGLWTTVYKRFGGDWKIVMVHESHFFADNAENQ